MIDSSLRVKLRTVVGGPIQTDSLRILTARLHPEFPQWRSSADLICPVSQAVQPALDGGLGALLRRLIERRSLDAFGQILLPDEVAGKVVGVEIVPAVAHRLAAGIGAGAEVKGNALRRLGADGLLGAADRDRGGVALWR